MNRHRQHYGGGLGYAGGQAPVVVVRSDSRIEDIVCCRSPRGRAVSCGLCASIAVLICGINMTSHGNSRLGNPCDKNSFFHDSSRCTTKTYGPYVLALGAVMVISSSIIACCLCLRSVADADEYEYDEEEGGAAELSAAPATSYDPTPPPPPPQGAYQPQRAYPPQQPYGQPIQSQPFNPYAPSVGQPMSDNAGASGASSSAPPPSAPPGPPPPPRPPLPSEPPPAYNAPASEKSTK